MISDDTLYSRLISPIKHISARIICIMDCCHSGTIMDLPFQYDDIKQEWFNASSVEEEYIATVIVISGCMDTQTSADATINNIPQGAMTFCYRRAIEEGAKTLHEVLIKIRGILKQNNFTQIPQLTSSKKLDPNMTLFPE